MNLKDISSTIVELYNSVLELEREYLTEGLTPDVIDLKGEIQKLEEALNNEIKMKKNKLGQIYLKTGLTEDVVDLSKELDTLIVCIQKNNLRLFKLGILDVVKYVS